MQAQSTLIYLTQPTFRCSYNQLWYDLFNRNSTSGKRAGEKKNAWPRSPTRRRLLRQQTRTAVDLIQAWFKWDFGANIESGQNLTCMNLAAWRSLKTVVSGPDLCTRIVCTTVRIYTRFSHLNQAWAKSPAVRIWCRRTALPAAHFITCIKSTCCTTVNKRSAGHIWRRIDVTKTSMTYIYIL